jgi:hypothetical protein
MSASIVSPAMAREPIATMGRADDGI